MQITHPDRIPRPSAESFWILPLTAGDTGVPRKCLVILIQELYREPRGNVLLKDTPSEKVWTTQNNPVSLYKDTVLAGRHDRSTTGGEAQPCTLAYKSSRSP